MNTVDRIKALCKERKIPISKLEKDLGFGNGYIGQLKKGVVPGDRIKLISNYFNVSMDFLVTGKEMEFVIEMAQTDVELSNMSKRVKEYAIRLNKLPSSKQEHIMQLIDMLEEKG